MSLMLGLVGDRGLAWGPRDPSVGCSLFFLKGHWWWDQPEDCCGLSSRPCCHLCLVWCVCVFVHACVRVGWRRPLECRTHLPRNDRLAP